MVREPRPRLSHRAHQRGSSLMLMPAAVLVFVVLGALAVDLSVVHLGQRDLVAAAQGAANDAAAAGFDDGAFYDGGRVALDVRAARAEAAASLAATDPTFRLVSLTVVGDSVEIRAETTVPTIFSRGVPGGPHQVSVSARASAALVPGGPP